MKHIFIFIQTGQKGSRTDMLTVAVESLETPLFRSTLRIKDSYGGLLEDSTTVQCVIRLDDGTTLSDHTLFFISYQKLIKTNCNK